MKHSIAKTIMLVAACTVCGVAGAQTDKTMEKNNMQRVADTVKSGHHKVEDGVVSGYKAVENGVVRGYKAVENGVVEGYTRVSDAFIRKFFMRKGETLEEARARMAHEEELLHQEGEEYGNGNNQ